LVLMVLVAVTLVWNAQSARTATADDRVSSTAVVGIDSAVVQPVSALREYTVAPGDTLWTIAGRIAADQDPRQMVDRLIEINALGSQPLSTGTVLLLPTRVTL